MNSASKLVLGTVQFGLDYGINNRIGQPDLTEVFKILDLARGAGIQLLDTARAYGEAEERLGTYFDQSSEPRHFQLITKLHPGDAQHWQTCTGRNHECRKI